MPMNFSTRACLVSGLMAVCTRKHMAKRFTLFMVSMFIGFGDIAFGSHAADAAGRELLGIVRFAHGFVLAVIQP
jgi:hypothetical protein